jgi:ribosome-binding factor A
VRDALVEVLRFDLKDVALGLASITEVEVSPDLHFARVFVSGLNEDETRKVVEELRQRQGRIRSFLGKRIRLRFTPELDFRFDETTMRASRVEGLLSEIRERDEREPGGENGD